MNFELAITYTQINVHDIIHNEFNDWTQEHVEQGFSWRKGHVSFGVPDHDGMSYVETIIVKEEKPLTPDVIRCIRVPFHAQSNVILSTVIDDVETDIKAGYYSLDFRLLDVNLIPIKKDYFGLYIQILFKKEQSHEFTKDEFKILRKSDEMTSDKVITTTAEIA